MKNAMGNKNKITLVSITAIAALLIILGHFVPVKSVPHSDWCADWGYAGGFKERYKLIEGQKAEFDQWNNNDRLAIGCETTEKSVKLYLW
jgi:hypothetical protein